MIRKSIREQVPSNLRRETRDQIIDLQLSECVCSLMKHSKSETGNQSIRFPALSIVSDVVVDEKHP
jgi:hypothetical protein